MAKTNKPFVVLGRQRGRPDATFKVWARYGTPEERDKGLLKFQTRIGHAIEFKAPE